MENDLKNVSGAQFPQPPEDFAVKSATTAFKFLRKDVPPPFPCYVGVDDRLLLSFVFDNGGTHVNCNVRILRDDGEIIPLNFSFTNGLARTVNQQSFQLVEGFILSLTILSQQNTGTGAMGYAWAAIIRPPNTTAAQYELLCAGPQSLNIPVCYPTNPPARPTDGQGQPRAISIATPAAGVDFTFTIPTLTRYRLVSLSGTLTTAVAVANRNVDLIIDDGANVLAEITSGFSQVASLVTRYTWMDSGPRDALFDNMVVLPLPANLILPPTFRIRSATTAIQGADQWSAIFMHVMEWFDIG